MIISRNDSNNDYNMHMYKKNKLTITSIFKYVIELSKVNLILNNFLSQIRGIICFILYTNWIMLL